jgi:hypothetical protein
MNIVFINIKQLSRKQNNRRLHIHSKMQQEQHTPRTPHQKTPFHLLSSEQQI